MVLTEYPVAAGLASQGWVRQPSGTAICCWWYSQCFSVEGTVLSRYGYIHVFQHKVGIMTVMCSVGDVFSVYDQPVFIDNTNQLSAVYLTTEIDRGLYWHSDVDKARRRLTNLTRQRIKPIPCPTVSL